MNVDMNTIQPMPLLTLLALTNKRQFLIKCFLLTSTVMTLVACNTRGLSTDESGLTAPHPDTVVTTPGGRGSSDDGRHTG